MRTGKQKQKFIIVKDHKRHKKRSLYVGDHECNAQPTCSTE